MALSLYANPYDITAPGFYFKNFKEYTKKADASGVEEFEIDFIDGDDIEQMLFNAMKVNQGNIDEYFDAVDEFDEDDATRLAILTDDMGYSFEESLDLKDDLIVYGEFASDEEFAMEYVEGIGSIGDALGKNAENYFDFTAFGRDLNIEGYGYDEDTEEDRFEDMSNQEIGEEVVDDMGGVSELSKRNQEMYFDWTSFARDLMFDMSRYNDTYYDPNSI